MALFTQSLMTLQKQKNISAHASWYNIVEVIAGEVRINFN